MKTDNQQLIKKAYSIRKNVVESIGIGHRGHFGGAMSIAEILAVLFFQKMKHDPRNPQLNDRDRFILSKGHAAPGLYGALAEAGYFPKSELLTFKNLGSMLQGHPDMLKTPGIEANTGSLGQGLSIGCGIALGLKMDNLSSRVYVIAGDGELGEGQIWEAALFAVARKLDNITLFIDHNKIQAMGPLCERMDTGNIASKWEAMGWMVSEIDGHNIEQISDAVEQSKIVKEKPAAIIAHTIKGKGISFMEGTAAFHNNELNSEQYEQALKELEAIINL